MKEQALTLGEWISLWLSAQQGGFLCNRPAVADNRKHIHLEPAVIGKGERAHEFQQRGKLELLLL